MLRSLVASHPLNLCLALCHVPELVHERGVRTVGVVPSRACSGLGLGLGISGFKDGVSTRIRVRVRASEPAFMLNSPAVNVISVSKLSPSAGETAIQAGVNLGWVYVEARVEVSLIVR